MLPPLLSLPTARAIIIIISSSTATIIITTKVNEVEEENDDDDMSLPNTFKWWRMTNIDNNIVEEGRRPVLYPLANISSYAGVALVLSYLVGHPKLFVIWIGVTVTTPPRSDNWGV